MGPFRVYTWNTFNENKTRISRVPNQNTLMSTITWTRSNQYQLFDQIQLHAIKELVSSSTLTSTNQLPIIICNPTIRCLQAQLPIIMGVQDYGPHYIIFPRALPLGPIFTLGTKEFDDGAYRSIWISTSTKKIIELQGLKFLWLGEKRRTGERTFTYLCLG